MGVTRTSASTRAGISIPYRRRSTKGLSGGVGARGRAERVAAAAGGGVNRSGGGAHKEDGIINRETVKALALNVTPAHFRAGLKDVSVGGISVREREPLSEDVVVSDGA